MRILHLSDLHLGRGLGDLSREAEQRALVREVCVAARELDVALTLISGDVFDAFTPPAWAEDAFFELVDGLADGGRRAVAVIAGNHDSGVRIGAADPLARRLGIALAGEVGEPLLAFDGGGDRVRTTPLAPQVILVEIPRAESKIVIGLMPFLSEAKVERGPAEADLPSGEVETSRYAARLTAELAARASIRDERAFHVLAMHQYVTGGVPSDSERRLRVGAVSDLDASAIPADLDYVALGHLHRPQEVPFAPSRAIYAGSPIAYSFSEAGQTKRAVLVELRKGKPAKLTDVPLTSGRALEIWPVASIDEARARAEKATAQPFVDVRAAFGRRLSPAEVEALFSLSGVTVANVRDLFVAGDAPPRAFDDEPEDVAVEDLFRDLWRRKMGGEPEADVVHELADAVLEVERGEGSAT